jgi:hypothetical protein
MSSNRVSKDILLGHLTTPIDSSSSSSSSSSLFSTAAALSLFSICSLLLYQRNKQLLSTTTKQREQLFLLTTLDDELAQAARDEAAQVENDLDSPRSDGGSVSSLTVNSSKSNRSFASPFAAASSSSAAARLVHNPYVESSPRPRAVHHNVRLLQPAPVSASRMRSCSEGLISMTSSKQRVRPLKQVSISSEDATVFEIDALSPGGDDARPSLQFLKSPSYYEIFRDETPSLPSSGEILPAPNHAWTALGLEQPLVIAMVGLPARGKSYLVKVSLSLSLCVYVCLYLFDCLSFSNHCR